MSIDNFALLSATSTVGNGSSLTLAVTDGSSIADEGVAQSLTIGAAATLDVHGVIRFTGAENISNGGTLNDVGVNSSDSLAGVIATVPALIQSYLSLIPSAIGTLP